jgi:hypothetical protein
MTKYLTLSDAFTGGDVIRCGPHKIKPSDLWLITGEHMMTMPMQEKPVPIYNIMHERSGMNLTVFSHHVDEVFDAGCPLPMTVLITDLIEDIAKMLTFLLMFVFVGFGTWYFWPKLAPTVGPILKGAWSYLTW